MVKKYAVILAGGAGLRAGGEVPKQFRMLCGLPVIWWSVKAFYSEDPKVNIRIVLHPGFFDLWDILYSELPEEERKIRFEVVCGGRDRLESVKNGIAGIPEPDDSSSATDLMIAVHDAARPLVTAEMIARGWECCMESGAAIPVVGMTDSIRRITDDGSVALDRSEYVRVQTPQIFKGDILKKGYSLSLRPEMTDDASVVEAAGMKVSLYEGDEQNMKITGPSDILVAETLLKERLKDE